MERHHKAAVLSSSSSHPAGLNRSPLITIRVAELKRCIWWPAKILSAIQLAVIVCFLICFLWCLWRLPQDHDEYPDGFSSCPNSSYKILDYRNVTIRCKSCLECPLGQELFPPCGSTTQSEASIECRKCPSDTYKESQGIGKCKPCQSCGLRETTNQCTPEKNAQCGECPRGYYQEDYTMDSCKRCSTCCGIKRFAEVECIYLKECIRKNCTQQIKIKEGRVLKSEDFAKMFATESSTHQKTVTQHSASQSDNPAQARNWVLQEIVSQLKKTKFKRAVYMTMQSADTGKNASQVEEASTYILKGNNLNPATLATVDDNGGANLLTPQSKLQEGLETASDYNVGEPPLPSTSSNSGNDNKLLMILIVLVAGLVGIAIVLILIAVIVVLRKQSGHFPGSGCTVTCCAKYIYLIDGDECRPFLRDTPLTDSDCQEIAHISDNGVDTSSEKSADTDDLESLALSDLSPTLENELIKRLDVRHKGEYGWYKLGKAFDIDKHDLKYLETAYQRNMQSPTIELLEILDKIQGRTVGDLLKKLKGSIVNRPDVARLICQKWQEIKYAQARK